MEPTTQATLVGGLLALLTLLLIGRSVGRRRARRAQADTATTAAPVAVEQPQAEADAPVEVAPEVVPEPEAEVVPEPDVEPEVVPEPDVEVASEVEPEVVPDVVAEATPAAPSKRRGLRRRRSRGGDAAAVAVVADAVVTDAVAADPEASDELVERADQAEVRALREQLRALEQVVQQQAADHPTAALARVEEAAAQQSEAYLRQVSLVVRGLAAHTSEDENPRRTLARVAAAVERLGVPNQMERPILPVTNELSSRRHSDGSTGPSHRLEVDGGPVELAPGPVPDVFAGLAAPSVVDAGETVLAVSYPEPAAATATARLEEPIGFGPEVDLPAVHPSEADPGIPAYQLADAVLPVPPPAAAAVTGRRRGLSRKSR